MKYFMSLLFGLSALLFGENTEDSKDAAKIEIILRQQRELEANELILAANKHHKEGRLEEAATNFSKAIKLYEKSSTSEKRILTKIYNSKVRLICIYKGLADKMIKEAEKAASVEQFEQAEKLLQKAKLLNQQISQP